MVGDRWEDRREAIAKKITDLTAYLATLGPPASAHREKQALAEINVQLCGIILLNALGLVFFFIAKVI